MASPPPGFTAAKAASLGQLLLRAARLFNELSVARLQRRPGLGALRSAHLQVLPHLDLDGTRPATLARRMGISRQAVGQLLDDLEQMGLMERVADPQDRRAKRVQLTTAGMAGLMEGLAALAALEVELAAEVGAAPLEALNDALVAILPALERRSAAELEAETPAQVEVEVDPIDPAPTARSRAGR